MNREVIGKCPVCSENLTVTKLKCTTCGLGIEGDLDLCRFCRLSEDEKNFIEIFLKNRGNLKEIEKELGVSYPTVRHKLDQVIANLGYKVKKESSPNKKDVLERLSSGKLSVEEAANLLKE